MKNWKILLLLVLIAFGTLFSCDEGTVPDPSISDTTLKVNKFIYETMDYYYLWYDEMPDIDYKQEPDPKAYFEKLLYTEEDKWSDITDDADAEENSLEGIVTSYGWTLARGKFTNTDTYFAIVLYVYPNTPAATAGMKRGDIIMSVNGGDITLANYSDLYDSPNISVTKGVVTENGIAPGGEANMIALELNLNPVVKTTVVEHGGHKIGYLFYAQFITSYNNAIDTALQSLLNQNITDLVLDLRYNLGGQIGAAQHLCSALAPAAVVNDEARLVSMVWNDKRQKYWVDNQIMAQIQVEFDETVPVKMDLQNLHVLTGQWTASASEFTIAGLTPYMLSLKTVGDTTVGKYTAWIPIRPEDIYSSEDYYSSFNNWMVEPTVLRYANAWGVTDFRDGFAPDIPAFDDLFDTYPLGDMNDPLFKTAIEDITGVEIVAMKSAKKVNIPYQILNVGPTKFDRLRNNLIVDGEIKKQILESIR